MSAEHDEQRWERTRALFHELLELPAPERVARLAELAADDAALRAEVEGLLASHTGLERSGAFDGGRGGAEAWREAAPERVGPYRVLRRLGAGGMGEVWLAEDTRLGRRVALKQLPAARRENAEARARLLREARAAACLNHPHIATIYEVAEHDGRDTIAIEYVDGCTLAARLAEGPLPFDALLRVALPLAEALVAAHAQGVVHRDLKPSNVMLDAALRPKLVDFGLAKHAPPAPHADGASSAEAAAAAVTADGAPSDAARTQRDAPGDADTRVSTSLTAAGAVFGTPAAMSPEQVRGQPVDARSDVFAFGALLYEMACGEAPFRGANAVEVMGAVLHLEPPPLDARRPELPARFTRLVHAALAKPLDERVQGMHEVVRELTALTAGAPHGSSAALDVAAADGVAPAPGVEPLGVSMHALGAADAVPLTRVAPPDWRGAARLVVVALTLLALAAIYWSEG